MTADLFVVGEDPVHLLREEEHGRPIDGDHGKAQHGSADRPVEQDWEELAHPTPGL